MLVRVAVLFMVFTPLSGAAFAQDVCAMTVDLQRMFYTLITIAEDRARPTSAQLRQLHSIDVRSNAFVVTLTYTNSDLSSQVDIIALAYTTSTDILSDMRANRPMPLRLADPRTSVVLNRGLSVLGRLECPPPVARADQAADVSALPRAASTKIQDQNTGNLTFGGKVLVGISVITLLSIAIAGFFALETRNASLRKRYLCRIPVVFILAGTQPRLVSGLIEDISRKGVKISADAQDMPKVGTQLSLQFCGTDRTMKVQWSNGHFLGGEFTTYFSIRALRQIIGKSKAIKRSKRFKPKRNKA